MTECVFCNKGPGKEGEKNGLYRYAHAMVQIGREPGWAHHECMKKAVAAHVGKGEPLRPVDNKVIEDNNRTAKAGRVLPAKPPAPKADDETPRPAAAPGTHGMGARPKTPKPKAAPGTAPAAPTGTLAELLAQAIKLGYVEQPAPNGGIRMMRIKNFIKNYKGKAA